jgi:hypothetical protein
MSRNLSTLILMGTLLFFGLNSSVYAAERKKICKNITAKGKTTQKCRTVKIHKKLDGKKVPEKAKKK